MRSLLVRVRHTPDRLLHPLRRRKASERLRAQPNPRRVLVVCHGNICRSPLAGALLARGLTPFGIEVQSAGFFGFNRPVPAEALAAARRYAIDLATHRSQLVTAASARDADLIVVMDPAQRLLLRERYGRPVSNVLVLGDLDPRPAKTRAIRDPVDQQQDVFDEVYDRIARCVHELVNICRART